MRQAFSLRRNRAALRRVTRRLRRGRDGLAAVEFALILPAMLTLYFGVVEVAQGVMVDRKVTLLTRSLADLTTQFKTVTTADVNNIFDAAGTIMTPYTSVNPGMRIASIVVNAGGTARVCWVESRDMVGAPLSRGDTVTLPTELRVPNTSLVMVRANYRYEPLIGHIVSTPITLGNDTIYMRPRLGEVGGVGSVEQVARQGVAMCPS